MFVDAGIGGDAGVVLSVEPDPYGAEAFDGSFRVLIDQFQCGLADRAGRSQKAERFHKARPYFTKANTTRPDTMLSRRSSKPP